jgi:hypothetical protein
MPQSAERQKRALIDGLIRSRQEITRSIQILPPDCLDVVYLGAWSIKDLVAHLVGWDETNLEAIQEILGGKVPSFFQYSDRDWQGYNQVLVSRHRVEPFSRLLAAADESHRKLVASLESLPADALVGARVQRQNKLTITIPILLRAEARDELEHAGQIKGYFLQK